MDAWIARDRATLSAHPQGQPLRARWMDGWMDGWISDGWMAGLDGIDRWMDEWMDGCETGQPCSHTRKGNPCGRDGWMDGWMDFGWMDGWIGWDREMDG